MLLADAVHQCELPSFDLSGAPFNQRVGVPLKLSVSVASSNPEEVSGQTTLDGPLARATPQQGATLL